MPRKKRYGYVITKSFYVPDVDKKYLEFLEARAKKEGIPFSRLVWGILKEWAKEQMEGEGE